MGLNLPLGHRMSSRMAVWPCKFTGIEGKNTLKSEQLPVNPRRTATNISESRAGRVFRRVAAYWPLSIAGPSKERG